uniref:BRO1 domain-containing protein n=1 Tax=Caenorhabditis tropicalis TaxID=1561998 RepID=A0A1I7U0T9_9PELO
MKSICETQLGHNESLAEYTREHLRLMEVHEQNSGNVLREQWNQLNKEEEAKQLSGMNREVTELTIANFAIIRNIQNSLFNDFKKLASTVKKISDALFKNAYLLASKADATASDFGTNNAEFESYKMDFIKIFYQYVVLVAKQVREYSDENNKITQVHVHDPATLWEQEVDKLKKRGPGTLLLDTANQNTEELRFVPGTLNICPWTREESVDRIRALVANNLKEEDIESVAQKFEKLERMDTTNGNLRAVIGCGRKITDYVLIHHRLLLDQFEQTLAEIYEYNGPLKTYKQAIFINISNIYKENAKETFNFYLQCSSLAESYLDAQIAKERRCEDLVPDIVKPLLEDSMKASGSSLMPIPIYQQLPVQHNSQIPHPMNNTYNMWMNRTFPPAPPTPSSTGSQSDDIKAIVLNKVGRENFDKMTVRDILKCYGNIKKATTTNK